VATLSKLVLSGSSDGKGIKVVQTATAGTLIHTGPSNAADIDEVWLYAFNYDSTARDLTIEWGSTSSPDDLIELSIEPKAGLTLVVPGLLLKGNASPLIIRAFAQTTNVIMIQGYVNRIES
jgi:hypothetical protein